MSNYTIMIHKLNPKDIVYIAGPIKEVANFKENFKKAQVFLRSTGATVINPAELSGNVIHGNFNEYLDICATMVSKCNCIYLLKGYEKSIGAVYELEVAKANGLHIIKE